MQRNSPRQWINSYVTIYSRERWIFWRSLLSRLMHNLQMMKPWFHKDFNLSIGESCLEPKVTCDYKFSKLTSAQKKTSLLMWMYFTKLGNKSCMTLPTRCIVDSLFLLYRKIYFNNVLFNTSAIYISDKTSTEKSTIGFTDNLFNRFHFYNQTSLFSIKFCKWSTFGEIF